MAVRTEERPPRTGVKFVHFELGKDIPVGIPGFYTPYREVKLAYHGREVLYVVGKAVWESSCCGTGNWTYTTVPGYILNWHSSAENGLPVSEVEPITSKAEQEEIRKVLEDRESAELITFW